MTKNDYWEECISVAAEECGAVLTREQVAYIAESVSTSHECYGMAFYSPPASDRLRDIESEYKRKLQAAEAELEAYRQDATAAVRNALRLRSDEPISIEDGGSVHVHGGRTTRVL